MVAKPDFPSFAEQFLIVGIGASAGGLDAFTQLLRPLPPIPAWRLS